MKFNEKKSETNLKKCTNDKRLEFGKVPKLEVKKSL